MNALPPACHGVTLEQYAGIIAALADDVPLGAVLALEALDERGWKRAARAWKEQLAGGGVDGPLFAALQRARIEAEDWLDRPVTPLADDLVAWVGFLQGWSKHPAPFKLLAEAGLRMADVARLQRRWSRRFESDDALGKRAAELSDKGAPPLSAITVGVSELRPFRWSRGRAVAPPGKEPAVPTTGGEPPSLSLDRYASLSAALAEPGADRAGVCARLDIDESRLASLDAVWKERLRADEGLARDYRHLFDHQRARLRTAARDAPAIAAPSPESPPQRTPPSLGGTALALDVPRGPALPFVEGTAPPAPSGEKPAPRPSPSLAGTALALDVPRGPALPFADRETSPAERAPQKPSLAGTALALDVPRGPALPFVEGQAPRAEGSPQKPSPSLGGTALALDVPRGPALPFADRAAPSATAPPPVERPSQKPAPPLGGTALALDVPRGPALPFAASSPATLGAAEPVSRTEAKAAAPVPKLAQMRVFELPESLRAKPLAPPSAPASPASPPLTVEQYASFREELAAAPNREAEILARYRLTTAEREKLDRHFAERFAREPGLRAEWERACATYRGWMATQHRR